MINKLKNNITGLLAVENKSIADTKQNKPQGHNLLIFIFLIHSEKADGAEGTGDKTESSDCLYISVRDAEIRKNNCGV